MQRQDNQGIKQRGTGECPPHPYQVVHPKAVRQAGPEMLLTWLRKWSNSSPHSLSADPSLQDPFVDLADCTT